jgi:hypothetical protein
LHVGVHAVPSARVEVQSFRTPLVMASDASHESPLHTAVSVKVPTLHDLVPDRVYPAYPVSVHDEPIARLDQHEPRAPLVMAPDASHEDGIPHFSTRPAVTVARSASVSLESKMSTSPM